MKAVEEIAKREVDTKRLTPFAMIPERDELLNGLSMKESNELVKSYNKIIEKGKKELLKAFEW